MVGRFVMGDRLIYRQRIALSLLILWFAASAAAQEATLRPGRLSKEEQAALVPGVQWEFFASAKPKEVVDARVSRLAALYVPAGEPPTPFMPAGPFTAKMTAWLKAPLKGDYRLELVSRSEAILTLNGQGGLVIPAGNATAVSVSSALPLVKGYNRLEVTLHSLLSGEAKLQLFWSGSDFTQEPLPPDLLFTRGDGDPLKQHSAERAGRELLATRSCVQCHEVAELKADQPFAMPEMAFEAPSLAGVGDRLQADWLASWILEPQKLRPTATMPSLLHGDVKQNEQQAADIAAYLATLTVKEKVGEDPSLDDAELVEAGLKLFEHLGCIACHHTKEPTHEDPHARRSLHYFKTKFAPGQLAAFLQQPQQHYAWSKMPDFKLSREEATALTAYLHANVKGELAAQEVKAGDAKRGEELFSTIGCANCHRTAADTPPLRKVAKTLASLVKSAGCLAPTADERGKAPDFRLAEQERDALVSFLATDRQALTRETPAEFSRRQVATLNCVACHRRDGASSILSTVLQDESELGVTPEILPALTWAGEKLKPQWTEKLFAGEHDQRSRHWLKARMPAFPARAKLLSSGLSHEHGVAIDENPQPKHDPALALIGEKLVGDAGGFSCIKCHAIGKRPPLAPFEAPGINLVDAKTRLRHLYYPRWMLDPPRVDVSTKMPKFSADGRTTGVMLEDGDAHRQFNALWHYIQSLPAE